MSGSGAGVIERLSQGARPPAPAGGRGRGRVLGLLVLAGLLAWALSRTVVVVEPGQVAVPVRLGAVQADGALGEGLHLADPFTRFPRMTVRRQILEMSSGGGAAQAGAGAEVMALSADQLPMAVDVGIPFALNPGSAPRIFQRIGGDAAIDGLVRPAARTAVRDALALFRWEEAATTRREALAEAIGARFRALVEADLRGLGLSEAEARDAFAMPPVVLRRVMPPLAVQEAIGERLRARQELEKQETLTEIARQEAARRSLEGQGIGNLIRSLPEGYGPEQVAALLNALANRTRAEALAQATRHPGVQMVVMEGGAGPPLLPAASPTPPR